MVSYCGSGMSVMEMSHRSKEFAKIIESAEQIERSNVIRIVTVLFLQGGGYLQFSMIPINLFRNTRIADYVITGSWAKCGKGSGKAGAGEYSRHIGVEKFHIYSKRICIKKLHQRRRLLILPITIPSMEQGTSKF